MSNYTFDFEELRPYKGIDLMAYGKADLIYRRNPAMKDVGIMSPYYTYDVESISLSPENVGGAWLILDPKSEMFKLIEEALQTEHYGTIDRELEEFDSCLADSEY